MIGGNRTRSEQEKGHSSPGFGCGKNGSTHLEVSLDVEDLSGAESDETEQGEHGVPGDTGVEGLWRAAMRGNRIWGQRRETKVLISQGA